MESDTMEEVQESDSYDTEKTMADVLEELENAWYNEKSAPEILQHKSENVDCLLQQLHSMEKNLESLPRDDLRINIHKMEIDRIRYLISSYLRIRLKKIELYAINIIQQESKRDEHNRYLTDAELKYAKDWVMNMETLLRTLVMQHLPEAFRDFEADKIITKPNVHSHVFIRANRDIDAVIIPGERDEEVDLSEGSQHIIQYKAVAHLVKDGSVQLI